MLTNFLELIRYPLKVLHENCIPFPFPLSISIAGFSGKATLKCEMTVVCLQDMEWEKT